MQEGKMMTPKYSLPFHPSRDIKRQRAPFHKVIGCVYCIDFAMPLYTPVLAARSGEVIACESRYNKNYKKPENAGHCNYIRILHSDGSTAEYAHLAWRSLKVRKGQKIRRGQIIALSGNTGYATYPHLHFGIYDVWDENIKIFWQR